MANGPRISQKVVDAALGPFDEFEFRGAGTFGDCWRVKRGTDEMVLKVIVVPIGRDRFAREVDALGRIANAHVMGIEESGYFMFDNREIPWFTGEYVHGGNVAHRAERENWPDEPALKDFLLGMLSGLQALHDADVVHRDLKPLNIALRSGLWSDPVILDLGLARLLDRSSLTIYPNRLGTVPYMSPEQLQEERVYPRSDVFGLAVVAYELMTLGRHPFVNEAESIDIEEALKRMGRGPQIPLREGSLWPTLQRMLAFQSHQRPSAIRAFRWIEEVSL